MGLITYGTQVHVHELGFSECPRIYVFRGDKEVTVQQMLDQLGLSQTGGGGGGAGTAGAAAPRDGVPAASVARFLLPANECEFTLGTVSLSSPG